MAREEPSFKIKFANFHLFVLLVNTTDFEKLKTELAVRINQTPGFFSNAPMVLGLAAIEESGVTPDFVDLVAFMRALGMQSAGVLGGSEIQREAAVQAGLGLFPETSSRPAPQPTSADDTPLEDKVTPSVTLDIAPVQPQTELPGFETDATKPETEPEPKSTSSDSDADSPPSIRSRFPVIFRPTLIIDKPVRTGQRIYAEGANLVVLAIVNAGAELIADGDIHIYAPLRGRAIAGAHGSIEARIFVQRMEAELISIAGCFQVFENGVPENVRGKAAQVHLEGSRLIFQPLPV